MFTSSTRDIPEPRAVPRHVAIIMDGNGRWAKQRMLPRVAGHRRGVEAVRAIIRACIERDVEYLTLFAFSSENWRRPPEEVSILMDLFLRALEQEVAKLHANGIRFKVVGDTSRFDPRIRELIAAGEAQTAGNTRLTLTVAANYGGRWDIAQAARRYFADHPEALRDGPQFRPEALEPFLAMAYAPEPDLFIRTGGEQRISNFLLWQLAYTELYFTDMLWPDFDAVALNAAIDWYRQRERRFGRTSEQVQATQGASCTAATLTAFAAPGAHVLRRPAAMTLRSCSRTAHPDGRLVLDPAACCAALFLLPPRRLGRRHAGRRSASRAGEWARPRRLRAADARWSSLPATLADRRRDPLLVLAARIRRTVGPAASCSPSCGVATLFWLLVAPPWLARRTGSPRRGCRSRSPAGSC